MKYKKLLRHLTSPFAYRPARIIQLRQYKADPQQNKVRVSHAHGLIFLSVFNACYAFEFCYYHYCMQSVLFPTAYYQQNQ